jgi:hypothetical protein
MTAASGNRPVSWRTRLGLPVRRTSTVVALPGKGKGKGTNIGRVLVTRDPPGREGSSVVAPPAFKRRPLAAF